MAPLINIYNHFPMAYIDCGSIVPGFRFDYLDYSLLWRQEWMGPLVHMFETKYRILKPRAYKYILEPCD